MFIHLCAPALLGAQNITDTSNGTLNLVVSFTVVPGTSNSPTSRTVNFRVRCMSAAGYQLAASAVYSTAASAPADNGRTIQASDIGVGITAIDTSGSEVLKPRADTIAFGFDYDPANVPATNGLTPYTGKASGQATLADFVDNPIVTILAGPQVANTEDTSSSTNYISVTMTFALVPQYFTPGTFTAVITLSTSRGNPETMTKIKPNGANHHAQELFDSLWDDCIDVIDVCANRICPDDGNHHC
ncbi:MAG: hypothetical protein LAP85_18380 [Acidobacteriia bacterium]|nr:hypothetical protein [Terriglobia bacterium]